jgi:proteasome assembly chaperone (PAC2) family protein
VIEDISVRFLDNFKDKKLESPVLIEGLPGIGQVG